MPRVDKGEGVGWSSIRIVSVILRSPQLAMSFTLMLPEILSERSLPPLLLIHDLIHDLSFLPSPNRLLDWMIRSVNKSNIMVMLGQFTYKFFLYYHLYERVHVGTYYRGIIIYLSLNYSPRSITNDNLHRKSP